MSWHKGNMLGFDLETTGLDVMGPAEGRAMPVTATLDPVGPNKLSGPVNWLADPGVEIGAKATAVHGITTEYARAHGRPLREVLEEVADGLGLAIRQGVPIVGMNLTYDFGVLDNACRMHGVPTLGQRVGGDDKIAPVIDVYCLDRHLVPDEVAYNRPRQNRFDYGRKLYQLAAYYKVPLDNAHNSAADTRAAMRIAYKMAANVAEFQCGAMELHAKQKVWWAKQVTELAARKARQGKKLDDPRTHWPIKPWVPIPMQRQPEQQHGFAPGSRRAAVPFETQQAANALSQHFQLELLATTGEVL